MKIQQGKPFHLEEICQVMEQAKRRLKALGLDQWQKGYPSRAVWEEDLDLERPGWPQVRAQWLQLLP